jgi:cytoskeleton protein RodZ
VLFNQILQPGEGYRVPNRHGLFLTAEHGNAVELTVDGKTAGTAGQTADATEAMPLDPAALAKRSGAPNTPE